MFGIAADQWLFAVIVALVMLAVILFIEIQRYMEDPLRKQRNDEWFREFQAYVASRYRADAIGWRVDVFERSFAHQTHSSAQRPH
jgi:hypothetical protein